MPNIYFYIFLFSITLIGIYATFPRQTKNFIYLLIPKWRREFVVVHFRKSATQIPLKYYVIPDSKTGMGTIERGIYDLHKDHALPMIPTFNNRLHFLINEGDSIPKHADLYPESEKLFVYKGKIFFNSIGLREKEIEYECPECHKIIVPNKNIFRTWAFRVKAALTTQAYDFIYGEKRQWAFIIAIIAAAIAVIVAIYAVMQIQEIKPLVATIYEKTIIGNETMVIKKV